MNSRLKDDWNRRIEHDHRYWMSDGFASDEDMFKSGKRDFAILKKALKIEDLSQLIALELGCGVGRLLAPASKVFKKAIGIDVSNLAIDKAKTLLADQNNIELFTTDGKSIPLGDNSIDVAICYATLSVIPVTSFINCMLEINRVLKTKGRAVVQVYLGAEHTLHENNTLGIRCYNESRYIEFLNKSGFQSVLLEELILPIGEVSDYEEGIIAHIHCIEKVSNPATNHNDLLNTLVEESESTNTADFEGSKLEYTMAITLAQALVEKGELEHALKTFEFALTNYSQADPDIARIIEEINKILSNQ